MSRDGVDVGELGAGGKRITNPHRSSRIRAARIEVEPGLFVTVDEELVEPSVRGSDPSRNGAHVGVRLSGEQRVVSEALVQCNRVRTEVRHRCDNLRHVREHGVRHGGQSGERISAVGETVVVAPNRSSNCQAGRGEGDAGRGCELRCCRLIQHVADGDGVARSGCQTRGDQTDCLVIPAELRVGHAAGDHHIGDRHAAGDEVVRRIGRRGRVHAFGELGFHQEQWRGSWISARARGFVNDRAGNHSSACAHIRQCRERGVGCDRHRGGHGIGDACGVGVHRIIDSQPI